MKTSLLSFGISTAVASVAAVGMAVAPAQAASLTGSISFGGPVTTNSGDLENATGLDFADAPSAVVFGIDGDFLNIPGITPFLTTAEFKDFTFNPSSTPVEPLWTLLGPNVSFNLESVVVETQDADTLSLTGTGTLMADGYDDTPAAWSFSADSPTGIANFAFSSGTAAVPEPTTMAGLAIAGGLGLFGAKKKKQSQDV